MKYTAAIFDLDGVLVDTAHFHYLAWKETARELGFDFSSAQNELLKGVSRMAALDILLRLAGREASPKERQYLAEIKNRRYVAFAQTLKPHDILPGVKACLQTLRERGVGIALGSASKNAAPVLERLNIKGYFDAIIDGTKAEQAKPDPQVFVMGAKALGRKPSCCVVFEDAVAGIKAAKAAGMFAVGVGKPEILLQADCVVQNLDSDEVYRLFV